MDTRHRRRQQSGKTCYWFINYKRTELIEPRRAADTTREHYCSSSTPSSSCDFNKPNSNGLMHIQNECPREAAGAPLVRPSNRGQDCGGGQMIKASRLRSRSDQAIRERQERPHKLEKDDETQATRPRATTRRLLRRAKRSRQHHAGGLGHSFIMLTVLNLILLLYHLEAPPAPLVTGHGQFVIPRLLFALAEESESMIEVRRFLVPAQVRPGELRRLACQYELHGASLHAMKLFKDDKEFYRYTPGNPPGDQRLAFPGAGVQVDMSRSGERDVWLKIGKRSTGQYKCQVTIEGKFISVSAEKRMEVITGTGGSLAGGGGGGDPTAAAAAGAQTGGGGGGGMWRHHPASPAGSSGSRVAPTYQLNQDQLGVRRLPGGEMFGLNTVMQSSVGVLSAAPCQPVLCACLLLALVVHPVRLLLATRTRAR